MRCGSGGCADWCSFLSTCSVLPQVEVIRGQAPGTGIPLTFIDTPGLEPSAGACLQLPTPVVCCGLQLAIC